MRIKIAQIKNEALKAVALEVDEAVEKNGYIDNSEINLFTNKAVALINEQKCTAQDLATIFSMNEADNTNTTDVFAKVDSLHNAKNTPEALEKEAEKIKQAEKQEKMREIRGQICENNRKLKHYEKILSAKEISYFDYSNDLVPIFSEKGRNALLWTLGGSFFGAIGVSIIYDIFESLALEVLFKAGYVGAALTGVAMGGLMIYQDSKATSKKISPKEQEKWRNEYKEAYLKVSQENEQLKAQLAVVF